LENIDGNWNAIDLGETEIEINGNLQSINKHLFTYNKHGYITPIVNDKFDKIIIQYLTKINVKI